MLINETEVNLFFSNFECLKNDQENLFMDTGELFHESNEIRKVDSINSSLIAIECCFHSLFHNFKDIYFNDFQAIVVNEYYSIYYGFK